MLFDFFHGKFSFLVRLFSDKQVSRLESDLEKAMMTETAEQYLSVCIGMGLSSAFLSLFLSVYSTLAAVSCAFFAFGVFFYAALKFPYVRKKIIGREAEKEMRFALRYFALQLRISVPFEKAIEKIADSNYKFLSGEFKRIKKNIENGESVPKALGSFASRFDSKGIRKMTNALIITYQKGGDGTLLRKMIEEQNSVYRIRLKEYNSKLMVYSLFFTGIGAVAPALFQAVFTLGSVFLDLGIRPATAFIVIVFVFPFFNLCLMAWVKWKKP